jgi:glycosyltransferase involved in cell wall biosynthesis
MIKNQPLPPLVSVCIPTYNHAKYLKEALESVINQTYSNLEIIVVDNFSIDNTSEILALFTDKRIKVFQSQNNGSIAKSRNFAVSKSNGEWIAFLDSDDWWHINKIQTCSKYFTDSFDLIYHNMNIFFQTLQINHTKGIVSRQVKRPVLYNLIIRGNPIACSSVVVRKSTYHKVNGMNESIDLAGIEDYNTWLKISLHTDGFKRIKQNLGSYRRHDENFVRTSKSNLLPYEGAVKEFFPLLSVKQLKTIQANYKYSNIRENYIKGVQIDNKNSLLVLKYGSPVLRIKVLWMLMICKIKKFNK